MQSENQQGEKSDSIEINWSFTVQLVIIGVLILLVGYNLSNGNNGVNNGNQLNGGSVSVSDIIPTGVPAVYGKVIGVSYDDVSPNNPRLADKTISKLKSYEGMELNSEQMKRYISIGTSISCEYCCGAKSIIFNSGERACGCAHSFAMRGLAKYLLKNNAEMSNDEILSELGKWKVLFFPGIHEQKAKILESKGIDSKNYINLASNLYRGIEKGKSSGGSMVGGC